MEYNRPNIFSDGGESGEEKLNTGLYPTQQKKIQNQLKVENPADFKNSEINFATFEKSQTQVKKDKYLNGIQSQNNETLTPPILPTRGILKRAKIANNKNEDKKDIWEERK